MALRGMRGAVFVVLVLLIGLRPVQAQLLLNFNPANLSGAPGGIVTFNATLINAGTDPLFLNGADFADVSPSLTVDISPFFNNSPLSLAGGEEWTGDVFDVQIDSAASPGVFFGSFRVLGGPSDTDQAPLASQNFLVAVSAPEPNSLALFGVAALPVVAGLFLRRRCSVL